MGGDDDVEPVVVRVPVFVTGADGHVRDGSAEWRGSSETLALGDLRDLDGAPLIVGEGDVLTAPPWWSPDDTD